MKSRSWSAVLICLSMNAGTAFAQPEVGTAGVGGSAGSSEIVCKKFADPGTLIKKRKICLTRDEWSHLSEAARRNVVHHHFNNMGGADGYKPGSPGC